MDYIIRLYTLERDYVWTHDFHVNSDSMAREYTHKLLMRMNLHYRITGPAELWQGLSHVGTFNIESRARVEEQT